MVSGLRPEFVVMLYGSDQRPGMVYSRSANELVSKLVLWIKLQRVVARVADDSPRPVLTLRKQYNRKTWESIVIRGPNSLKYR